MLRVLHKGTISVVVMKIPANSDLTMEDMTNLMIWAIVRIDLLSWGTGLSSNREMCAPVWLRPLLLLRNEASVVGSEGHDSGPIGNAIVWEGGNVIRELVNGYHYVLSGGHLWGTNGSEGDKNPQNMHNGGGRQQ